MENEKDEMSNNNKEDIVDNLEKEAQDKKRPVAKDLVQLKHVKTKKQEITEETKALADAIKQQVLEQEEEEGISNDEITILESFVGKRLFLRRIAIVVNQSRIPLGIEPFKKEDLEKLIDRLIHKGFIDFDIVDDKRVYFLTEKGKEHIQ